jgi:hypothetical protein
MLICLLRSTKTIVAVEAAVVMVGVAEAATAVETVVVVAAAMVATATTDAGTRSHWRH